MVKNPYTAYQHNSVIQSTPAELTLMLYKGCLKFIEQAKRALIEGRIEDKNLAIQKAQAILTELMITLDITVPIANEILRLYDYANRQLIEGNIENDEQKFEVAADLLTEFRDTWQQVIQMNRLKQYGNVSEI